MAGYTGISNPFRFGGAGGVVVSGTSMDDYAHIQESIKQIILTGVNEREFETSFGSQVRSQLFKGYEDEIELSILKYHITDALEKWENRISVIDVVLEPMESTNGEAGLTCTITYEVTKYLSEDSVTFTITE